MRRRVSSLASVFDDRVVRRDGGRAVEEDVLPEFDDRVALREGRAELGGVFYGRGLVVGAPYR